MKKSTLLKLIIISLFSVLGFAVSAQTTYSLVTSTSDLEAGGKYLIVGKDAGNNYRALGKRSAGANGGNSSTAVPITISEGKIITTAATDTADAISPFEITIDALSGAWTLYDGFGSYGGFFKPRGSQNGFQLSTDEVTWEITFSGTLATITATNTTAFPRGR